MRGAMILTAALIEGVALFACAICFLIQSGAMPYLGELEKVVK